MIDTMQLSRFIQRAVGTAIKVMKSDNYGMYWDTISVDELSNRICQAEVDTSTQQMGCSVTQFADDVFVFRYPYGKLPVDEVQRAFGRCVDGLPADANIIAIPTDTTLENATSEVLSDIRHRVTDILEKR